MTYMRKAVDTWQLLMSWIDYALDFLVHKNRGPEWVIVFVLIKTALKLLEPRETLNLKAFTHIKGFGFNDEFVAVVLLFVAACFSYALARNGGWKRSPELRGACCAVSALIFSFFWYTVQVSPLLTPVITPDFALGYVGLCLLGCRLAGDDRRCLMKR